MRALNLSKTALVLAACSLWATCSTAQELSPRAYWPAPKGTKVAVFGYSYSFGEVATDPAVPIFGVDSKINVGFFGYLQTLSLWGRTANVLVELPYIWGTSKGIVEGVPRRRDVSGVGDIGVTLSVNLLGAPSMTPREFLELRKSPRSILGASVKVVGPTGEYEKDKLINVGANRWAVKAELGYVIPVRAKWLLELELGSWIFSDNDDFLGVTRGQRGVGAAEIHFVRRFNPGFWASLDLNYFWGGRSIVGGQLGQDSQRNSRLGGTVVVPFLGRHAIKFGYSAGVFTYSGGDYDTFLLSYQVVFR